MAHPLLQRANVNSVLQVPCRISVSELMKEPTAAVGAIGTAINFDRAVLKLVFDNAMTAVELGTVGHGLEFFEHCAVRSPGGARKQRVVGTGVFGPKSLKHRNELLWNRDFAFFPILRMKSPMRFCGDADSQVFEIDVAPSDETALGVAEA